MKKPLPLNQEVPFEFHELFFSTTDKKGVINFGNDVFLRISGYPHQTIIGAPHNIIRHPDMPKSVFRIFWSYIRNDKPIGAYVKNLAADGRYYWVFAFAFPVPQGYLSIRFKPSSIFFNKIQKIYSEVLAYEKDHTPEESEACLLNFIRSEGFETYDEFMVAVAVEELKAREDNALEHSQKKDGPSKIQEIAEITIHTSEHLDDSFHKIHIYQQGNLLFSKNSSMLEGEFDKLKFLSINMKILSGHYGQEAAALGVISEEFSKIAGQIEMQIKNFSTFIEDLKRAVELCSLHIAALKTQMIMVDYFVKESIEKLEHSQEAFRDMAQNRELFVTLFSASTQKLDAELLYLTKQLKQMTQEINGIQKLIIGLEVIKQTGAIESARRDDIKQAFTYYLVEMKNFMEVLKDTLGNLSSEQVLMAKATDEVFQSLNHISGNISRLFELALLKY